MHHVKTGYFGIFLNIFISLRKPIAYGPHVQQPEPQGNEGEGNEGEGNEGPILACHAPRTRVPRGRPKKERYRRGEGHRLAQRPPGAPEQLCSTCGQPGTTLEPVVLLMSSLVVDC